MFWGGESKLMKRLESLALHISLGIALKSIRVRFFRSLITTLSLVLAVAFLSFTQLSDDIAQSLLALGDSDLFGKLSKLGYDIDQGTASFTASAKQRWIVFLSLLVCVVGIINAQLMSVTERFREIGTMKCLGALDGFIVKIFIIEAAIQGLIGSLAGTALGAFSAFFMGIVRFGMLSISTVSWAAITNSMLFAIATGTALSLLGVLYPALVAARMQPVEAMRVEQ
jgi:putative ABC transport system permease protein